MFIPDTIDIPIGAAYMSAYNQGPRQVDAMEGRLAVAVLQVAPREWTFVDEHGEPLPLTSENIEARLTWNQGGAELVERIHKEYAEAAFAPLVKRTSKALPPGRTRRSTSRTRSRGSSTPSSDKPSLHTVTGGKPSAAKAS